MRMIQTLKKITKTSIEDETQRVDVHIKYNALTMNSQVKRMNTYQVPIVTFEDLIKMKKASSEEKDQTDLKFLLEIPK